jgi:hypothetical protein
MGNGKFLSVKGNGKNAVVAGIFLGRRRGLTDGQILTAGGQQQTRSQKQNQRPRKFLFQTFHILFLE